MMLIKEILSQETKAKKTKFIWYDGKNCDKELAYSMPNMHAVPSKGESTKDCQVWRLLCTRENYSHARCFRHVNSCIECLRLGFCEDIPDELKKEAKEHGQVNLQYKAH